MVKFTNKTDNADLIKAALAAVRNLSYGEMQKMLRKKDVKINGLRVSKTVKLQSGDEVELYYVPSEKKKIEIEKNFEDDRLLIVNKPEGIETDGENSLTELLQQEYGKELNPCHRLDTNTRGLLIFSKNEQANAVLTEAINERKIKKFYRCLVHGHPKKEQAELNDYLFKDSNKKMVYISSAYKVGCVKIVTKYRVISRFKDGSSLLEVELVTGRTHQIRAHLAFIGHPILGDGKYGNNQTNQQYGRKTQALIACRLQFQLPEDNPFYDLNNRVFEIKADF